MGVSSTLALSDPRAIFSQITPTHPDIWVLWDVSRSMRIKDVLPDRQRFALTAMEEALEALPSGRLGLIVFASDAYAVLPLTADREAFVFALRQAARLDLGEGTNLSAAVETALALAEPNTHILIVSDGAHNVPQSASLADLAEEAKKHQVTIHAVFIGAGSDQIFPTALKLLSEKTGGGYQEREFQLTYLIREERRLDPIFLGRYLWGLTIGIGLGMLVGMAIGGWFNVLTA